MPSIVSTSDPPATRRLIGDATHDGSSCSSASATQDPPPITIDLVTAARRHLSFLRLLSGSAILHDTPTILRSIHRYENLWMPLFAELLKSPLPPMIIPPVDIGWVWHCHCLHPGLYREYCLARFGAVVERSAIFDDENEEYAIGRCREIWVLRYPTEPFDLEEEGCGASGSDLEEEGCGASGSGGKMLELVVKYETLPCYFSDSFCFETVYLVAARRRYFRFLELLRRFGGELRMVPTSDVLLIWLTHQSFPASYAKDIEEMGMKEMDGMVVGYGETAATAEETGKAWEETFDEPYEKAGALLDPVSSPSRMFFNWEPPEADVNRRYKGLQPRFFMEVYIFMKGRWEEKEMSDANKTFLRLRTVRSHRGMRIDRSVVNSSSETWKKTWHLYCEFATRGIVLEVRRHGSSCLRNSKLLKKVVFLWNDILRSTSHTLTKELQIRFRAISSITPPVQAPYLLKCVPDRVTDDNGAMISDVILRMNQYRPQQGRWLSRTVLDHATRECFVIRIRVGSGIWRRGAEIPRIVNWEDRIIEIREGPWSYVASSVGSTPGKVAGRATPVQASQEKKAIWSLSTGDVLTVEWENGLNFTLENESSSDSVTLLSGRKLQYQLKEISTNHTKSEDDQNFVTLVRSSSDHPNPRATALLNWKLFAVEFLPEEDAVLVLLLCTAIVRTVSEIRREDVGGLLVRRRLREVKAGYRDWGSIMQPSPSSSSHLQPWYWNAEEVLVSVEINNSRAPSKYSPADGNDQLYRQAIIPRREV